MDRYNESREIGIFRWKRKRIIINVYKLYLHVFLRRRTNLNRKNDYVSSTTENALLPVQEQRWNWLKPTTTIEASSYTNKEREKKGERERESIMAHHRGRVDEKGGEKKGGKKGKKKINFQDRGNSVAFIAILPSHDLENREFLKSGGFAFKKQTVFTPLRPSLAFNPLLLLGFFFQPWIASSTPLLLSFPFFFLFPPFLRIQSKTNPLEFSKKSQWICRICIIRVSPFDFIPPLRDDLPKSGKNLPAFTPVSLSLCFVRFKNRVV